MNDTATGSGISAPAALDQLAKLPEFAGASACFGHAVTAGERTVIPVAEVQYGLGFGWGGGRDAKTDNVGTGAAPAVGRAAARSPSSRSHPTRSASCRSRTTRRSVSPRSRS